MQDFPGSVRESLVCNAFIFCRQLANIFGCFLIVSNYILFIKYFTVSETTAFLAVLNCLETIRGIKLNWSVVKWLKRSSNVA